ncbi:MAG TPA: class I SAM-dependent methyltransferase, partial [Herpetosiphonaceae bacterium]|nr:class I SAM-dependent methyltransferase [Herpetosiphonaceae bacterium]
AAQRPADWAPPPVAAATATISAGGAQFTVAANAGVFADGGLDPATALLLDALEVPPGASVLDLGCGAGIIALAISRRDPSAALTLVDSNVVAVATARRNLEANGVAGRVLASDGVAALAGETFDLVASNPPFHVGRTRSEALARRFISEAHAVLRPGGALWLVANRFLRYEPHIEATFGNVVERAGDSRFKVLVATRMPEGS